MGKYPNFKINQLGPRGSVGRVMNFKLGVREAWVRIPLGTCKKIKEHPLHHHVCLKTHSTVTELPRGG